MVAFIDKLDAQLEELFTQWNVYTTIIAMILIIYTVYPLLGLNDADTHPLLLSHQSNAAPVRQSGESAVYRSKDVPYGFPMRSGLNLREPGASKWSAGRDGDIRDIWRKALSGVVSESGELTGKIGKIVTIRGGDEVAQHALNDLTKEIIAIGKFLQEAKSARVAVFLPNSVEFISSVIAAAYYGVTPILIPYTTPPDVVVNYMIKTRADSLISQAGALPLSDCKQSHSGLRNVLWVVPESSRQMDWMEDIDGVHVAAWHDKVEENDSSGASELPAGIVDGAPEIVTIWQSSDGPVDITFTQKNIVSATAALNSALPNGQRLSPDDILLPADSLTHPYVLCLTLAALFGNASLALNSVASQNVDILLCARTVSPTIIVTSSDSALKLHKRIKDMATSIPQKLSLHAQTRSLAAGTMPKSLLLNKVIAPARAAIGPEPTNLRLLCISNRGHTDSPPLSITQLNELRCFTGAHVVYALTAPRVAGAIAQTNPFDYREQGQASSRSHFGPPLSSVEVKLVDSEKHRTTEDYEKVDGEIVVKGPAVVGGGEERTRILGRWRVDGTLEVLVEG